MVDKLFFCHLSQFIPMSQSNVLWLYTSGRGRKGSMAIENFQCVGHSLVSSVDYTAQHGCARKNFQNRSSKMDGKRYFEFGFCE